MLDVGPVRVGDVLCFQGTHDDLVRDVVTGGGSVIVVQTSTATSGRSGETAQRLAMCRVPAVERGRSVRVDATIGISAVLTPDGGTVAMAQVLIREAVSAPVPTRTARTLATRLGAVPELPLAGLAVVAAGLGLRRRAAS